MKFLVQGEEVDLTPTERLLLSYLTNSSGRIVSYDTLMNVVWDTRFLQSSAIKACIYRLRQKLPRDTIKSHRGFGYSSNKTLINVDLIQGIADHIPIAHIDCHLNSCTFCDGGLFGCSTCGALEGANTSECPGYRVGAVVWECVYKGGLDFRNGLWITEISPHSPTSAQIGVNQT